MMPSVTRSPARILAWGLAILSLVSSGAAFVAKPRPLSTLQPSKHEVELQVQEGSPRLNTLPRSLAVRGGADKVHQVATQAELEEILSSSGDALVCIDFTATWCSPCQQIAPAFQQLSEELTDVVFLKVDVDENEETAQKYEVFQMPTFLFMRNGEVVEQFSGANAAVLRQKIESLVGTNEQGGDGADAPRTDEK